MFDMGNKNGTVTKVRQLMFKYHAGHLHNFKKPSEETRAVVDMLSMFKQLHKIEFYLFLKRLMNCKSTYIAKKRPAFGNVNYLNASLCYPVKNVRTVALEFTMESVGLHRNKT